MTDKENKYNCRFFKHGCKCSLANGLNDSCEEQKVCEVKQLRQKEQECEELKKQAHCYSCNTCLGHEDYKNLERHCNNAINALHKEQDLSCRRQQALDEIVKIAFKVIHDGLTIKGVLATLSTIKIGRYMFDIIKKAKEVNNDR